MGANRFEADVRQILHLVTHSLYSDRETTPSTEWTKPTSGLARIC